MSLDFSLLQNIDVVNRDNLIFLSVFLILVIIFVLIFLWVISKIIKAIRKFIVRIFNIDLKPKFDKKNSTDWLHKLGEDENKIDIEIESSSGSYDTREREDTAEGLSKMQSDDSLELKEKNSEKGFGSGPIVNFSAGAGKPKEKGEAASKSFEAKEKEDIAEGLSKLKSKSILGGGVESKMPSRTGDVGDTQNKEIKIPVPAHHSSQPGFVIEQNNGSVSSGQIALPQKENKNVGTDFSIFGGKSEISRMDLEHELKKDAKVWQAERQEGLTLNSTERANLVKEVFSSSLGRSISKRDLKQSIGKLNKKMLSTGNMQEHAKLRKEIKFFKKIGGIK